MKLRDLQYLPPTTLATSQTVYRVQRTKPRPGTTTIGALKLAPAGDMSSRFAVPSVPAGYFAESPETAVYESLVRREAVTFRFCPQCGPTLFHNAADREDSIAIPVGAFADPSFPKPTSSVYEERMHSWVCMPDGIQHIA